MNLLVRNGAKLYSQIGSLKFFNYVILKCILLICNSITLVFYYYFFSEQAQTGNGSDDQHSRQ